MRTLIFSLFAATCVASDPSLSQLWLQKNPDFETVQQLELKILCEKGELISGEPLFITLSVKNLSVYPATLPWPSTAPAAVESQYIFFRVWDSNNKPLSRVGFSCPGDVAAPLILQPGESHFSSRRVNADFTLPKEGFVEMQIEYRLADDWIHYAGAPRGDSISSPGLRNVQYSPKGVFQSDRLKIYFSQPETSIDQEAYKFLDSQLSPKLKGASSDLPIRVHRDELISRFPASVFSTYARYEKIDDFFRDRKTFAEVKKFVLENDLGHLKDNALVDLYERWPKNDKNENLELLLQEITEKMQGSDSATRVAEIIKNK